MAEIQYIICISLSNLKHVLICEYKRDYLQKTGNCLEGKLKPF